MAALELVEMHGEKVHADPRSDPNVIGGPQSTESKRINICAISHGTLDGSLVRGNTGTDHQAPILFSVRIFVNSLRQFDWDRIPTGDRADKCPKRLYDRVSFFCSDENRIDINRNIWGHIGFVDNHSWP